MKLTLVPAVVILLGVLLAGAACAAPLAQLAGVGEWKAWTVRQDQKASGEWIGGAGTAMWRAPGKPAVWHWTGEWVGGQGPDHWSYAEIGSPRWANYQVDLRMRIDTPSAREGPKWEAGNWTWAAYRNNANAPDYEAGVALRKQGEELYRIMFSVRAQEVALWSSRGGFLRVVPYKLEAGRDYAVRVRAQGPQVKVAVDRRTVIDYYERHGVLASGGVALGLHEGAAAFSQVTVTPLPAFSRATPPHAADFHFREWKGARWAWDGDEPIFLLENDCVAPEFKLVPGWRAR